MNMLALGNFKLEQLFTKFGLSNKHETFGENQAQ